MKQSMCLGQRQQKSCAGTTSRVICWQCHKGCGLITGIRNYWYSTTVQKKGLRWIMDGDSAMSHNYSVFFFLKEPSTNSLWAELRGTSVYIFVQFGDEYLKLVLLSGFVLMGMLRVLTGFISATSTWTRDKLINNFIRKFGIVVCRTSNTQVVQLNLLSECCLSDRRLEKLSALEKRLADIIACIMYLQR